MSEDLSPHSLPFSTRMRELINSKSFSYEAASTTFEYVDLAKRMLLELRVRDFTGADVVALAAIMESRDRDFLKQSIEDNA